VNRFLLALALLAGCNHAKPGDEIIGELADLMNEMCACKDTTCADAVSVKHAALQQRAQTIYKSMASFPKENVNRIVLLDKQLKRCRDATSNAPDLRREGP